MYKINDYLVYKKDVCRVKDIKTNNKSGIDYYILIPICDDSLIIDVPIDNKTGFIRNVINKEETEKLIKKIPNIEPIKNIDDKYIERTYKDLISSGTHEDLIKIIKTSYLRNKSRSDSKKRLSDKDSKYFDQAEKYLYNELAISLGMSFEQTKGYIIKKVNDLVK